MLLWINRRKVQAQQEKGSRRRGSEGARIDALSLPTLGAKRASDRPATPHRSQTADRCCRPQTVGRTGALPLSLPAVNSARLAAPTREAL